MSITIPTPSSPPPPSQDSPPSARSVELTRERPREKGRGDARPANRPAARREGGDPLKVVPHQRPPVATAPGRRGRPPADRAAAAARQGAAGQRGRAAAADAHA